jgi:hypothetical protein
MYVFTNHIVSGALVAASSDQPHSLTHTIDRRRPQIDHKTTQRSDHLLQVRF